MLSNLIEGESVTDALSLFGMLLNRNSNPYSDTGSEQESDL